MIKVKTLLGATGWYVQVEVQGEVTSTFGPYGEDEVSACLEGMKAFAMPQVVKFETED